MAVVLRGKLKGEYVFIQRWCNDWIRVDTDCTMYFSPTSLQYTPEEFAKIVADHTSGISHELYEPDNANCRFKRRKRS